MFSRMLITEQKGRHFYCPCMKSCYSKRLRKAVTRRPTSLVSKGSPGPSRKWIPPIWLCVMEGRQSEEECDLDGHMDRHRF